MLTISCTTETLDISRNLLDGLAHAVEAGPARDGLAGAFVTLNRFSPIGLSPAGLTKR